MAENQDQMFDNLICPITLEPFTEPVFIPDCGHTFDRKGLINILSKKCPICNINFSGNPNNFKINWSIVSMLNIDIQVQDVANDILSYDAACAKKDVSEYILSAVNKLLVHILSNIKQVALTGKTVYELDVSKMDNIVLAELKNIMQKKGFSMNSSSPMMHPSSGTLRITW